ncbi:MAG: hypothetical protein HY644_02430 [Acidobacteria bacterium]|nr:hypothetical protein [Acidobacteriota bacterium]
MQEFLFGAYKGFSILLFLFLSAVLLYHRLLRRWLSFSIGFFAVYALGSYFFFGRAEIPFAGNERFLAIPYLLFFFGTLAVFGYCFIRQLTLLQSLGVLVCYLFALVGFSFVTGQLTGMDVGLPTQGSVERFFASAPYVILLFGTPIVFGYCLLNHYCLQAAAGAALIFIFVVLFFIAGTSNYFNRPFGFSPGLSLHTRAWIELGSLLLLVLGLPALFGYGLLNSWTCKQALGGIVLFLVGASAIAVLVQLTVGYEFLARAFVGR